MKKIISLFLTSMLVINTCYGSNKKPEEKKRRRRRRFRKPDKKYDKYFAKNYDKLAPILQGDPVSQMVCGLDYTMQANEMQSKIKDMLKKMKKKGRIISTKAFEKNKEQYAQTFYLETSYSNLERICIAKYINKECNSKGCGAPSDFLIVADNPNNIKVAINVLNFEYPIPTLENASIYCEKIEGEPVGRKLSAKASYLAKLGYVDFNDSGNIILDKKTGKYYAVDNEIKSFRIIQDPLSMRNKSFYKAFRIEKTVPPGFTRSLGSVLPSYLFTGDIDKGREFLEYTHKKFKDLNKNEIDTSFIKFNVDLSTLKK